VVIIRKGQEITKKVVLGRLEDTEKRAATENEKGGERDNGTPGSERSVVKRALGLDLANLTEKLRREHKIKGSVKGVVITGVDPDSAAAEKQLRPGMVIAEVQQEPVESATDLQQKLDKLKKDGKKSVVLLVISPDGDPSFVALALK